MPAGDATMHATRPLLRAAGAGHTGGPAGAGRRQHGRAWRGSGTGAAAPHAAGQGLRA